MKFRTVIEQSGKTTTGIRVPPEVVEGLGAGKRPAVRVTIGDYSYRGSIAVMGGVFMISVSSDVRARTGVAGGDEVDVEIELDTEKREVSVPTDFNAALDADPEARRFFDGLSYSNKLRIVLNIEGTKNPETRQRRIDKAVSGLHEGRA
jgi:hypothetical protein